MQRIDAQAEHLERPRGLPRRTNTAVKPLKATLQLRNTAGKRALALERLRPSDPCIGKFAGGIAIGTTKTIELVIRIGDLVG